MRGGGDLRKGLQGEAALACGGLVGVVRHGDVFAKRGGEFGIVVVVDGREKGVRGFCAALAASARMSSEAATTSARSWAAAAMRSRAAALQRCSRSSTTSTATAY